MQNIIAVLFENESEGFQAITELRHEPVGEKYAILQMALVKREGDVLRYCDGYDAGVITESGAAFGGLMGSLMGILGGPLGVLLMGSYGALTGSVMGSAATLDDALLVGQVAGKLTDGDMALIALAEETDEAVLDAKLGKFKAEIARFDAARVADEVEEALELQREEERLELLNKLKEKSRSRKTAIEEKREKLEAEFAAFKDKVAADVGGSFSH